MRVVPYHPATRDELSSVTGCRPAGEHVSAVTRSRNSVGGDLLVRRVVQSHNVASELQHDVLESSARPEERHLPLAGVADGGECAVEVSVRAAGRDPDRVVGRERSSTLSGYDLGGNPRRLNVDAERRGDRCDVPVDGLMRLDVGSCSPMMARPTIGPTARGSGCSCAWRRTPRPSRTRGCTTRCGASR